MIIGENWLLGHTVGPEESWTVFRAKDSVLFTVKFNVQVLILIYRHFFKKHLLLPSTVARLGLGFRATAEPSV